MFQLSAAILVCYTVLTYKNVLAILDGKPTTIEKHPYHITVESKGKYVAGGALITMTRVVTSAAVVTKVRPYQAVAGSTFRCPTVNAERIDVVSKDIHARYDPKTRDYDIAILHLERAFSWSNTISVIPLQHFDEEVPMNGRAVATGWRAPDKCRELELVSEIRVPDEDSGLKITERMHVFSNEGGKSRPESDGGCPLVRAGKLVGIDINQRIHGGVAYTVYLKLAHPEIRKFIEYHAQLTRR